MLATTHLATEILLPTRDYDLAATLESGQVFRWHRQDDSWIGVIGNNHVRLTQNSGGILAQTATPQDNWDWLRQFLQTDADLTAILNTFPDDEPMRRATAACRGLRVLRQEPWECLASFILSSTKQIVQIRQIIALLCEKFGEPLTLTLSRREREQQPNPASFSSDLLAIAATRLSKDRRTVLPLPKGEGRGEGKENRRQSSGNLFHSFPSPETIAAATESDLRACKMGFRAPHLLKAARQIAEGQIDLEQIRRLPLAEARSELMKLDGVGPKIADCVLLFAYGFDSAFPVDVWVERALRQLYFPRRRVSEKKLLNFAVTHFGPHAGYAQQYLFHYMRTKMK
ncbi:MAG TPA: DNA glycosylase [Verrucomicrobiae bacterium]|nr:DNA glycosylase [Verrucomicrobiae bacterium]